MNITPNYHIPKEELGEDYIKPKGDASITDDKGTQTDQLSESLDSEIVDLEKKYEEIRNKYQRIYTLVLGKYKIFTSQLVTLSIC